MRDKANRIQRRKRKGMEWRNKANMQRKKRRKSNEMEKGK